MSDVIALLEALVRFPSLSQEEGPIADFVEAYVRAAGLPVGRHEHNVYFWLGDGPEVLLLNSHLDVVPPAQHSPYPPFDPVVVDGQLYGRGTVDAKASGAAMTTAVLALAAAGWSPPKGSVMVALTACEERGGGYNGLHSLRPHLPPLAAALVGEPTALQPCIAQKGLLLLKATAHGRTAHAARAHLGDNAILRAMRDIEALTRLTFERQDPFLGAPTLNVTIITGGTVHNVIPDECTFTMDIRSTPAYTHEEIIQMVQEALTAEVIVHSNRYIPVATPATERIVQACCTALPGSQPFGSPTASDWIFLADVPTVKIGPGHSERSHTAEEHIALADVYAAVAGYERIIRAYFEA
jgi:acetylornithine deacetylase